MKEFMMLFRSEEPEVTPAPEDMQAKINLWQDWIGGIAAQDRFVGTNALGMEGKIVGPNNVVTDGPYMELKEMVGGYIIVKANDIDDAVRLAEGCPVLSTGGKVEVRDVMVFE
ncbi:MAG: transcription initiation protein [Crocinitomicaceae bacterium]|nr:YciI family protein [Flavobacteriales bacterium]NQZ35101.1 transcription initiation protein [Crocinitomicaceae bacterium]